MQKRFHWIPRLTKCFSSTPNIPEHSTVPAKPAVSAASLPKAAHAEAHCQWAKDPNDIRNVLCSGPILHAVQTSNVFPDCKTFVDMNVKTSVPSILSDWQKIEAQYAPSGTGIPMTAILKFLQEHFEAPEADAELEKWVPTDWTPNPKIADKIEAPEYKYFAKELNHLWLKLARKMSAKVQSGHGKTTLVYLPNGFIIPGGRFRELYYWDTYFIILGLLACEMFETSKGIIQNFLYSLKNYGSIYNGSRIYYQFRSQPPLLLMMVKSYVDATNDFPFLKENYRILEKEVEYWERNRRYELSIDGKTYDVFRYYCCTPGPRPESYREDIAAAQQDDTLDMKIYRYRAIASACESGWDFSSRWFKCKKGASVIDMHTHEIIPVDLMCFMHRNYVLLRDWARELKMNDEARKYATSSKSVKRTVNELLWDDMEGMWFDLDTRNGSLHKQYATSNFTPLWTNTYDWNRKTEIAEKMLHCYTKFNFWKYKGGLPTTMCFSGEQWDWPNAWAPLQLIASEGFRNVGLPVVATNIASNWVNNNYLGYLKHNVIFEKYDCRRAGVTGFGGEYEEQYGFGWSNGVLFQFLKDYADKLKPEPTHVDKTPFESTRELTKEEVDNLI